jgi:hypothetical protein
VANVDVYVTEFGPLKCERGSFVYLTQEGAVLCKESGIKHQASVEQYFLTGFVAINVKIGTVFFQEESVMFLQPKLFCYEYWPMFKILCIQSKKYLMKFSKGAVPPILCTSVFSRASISAQFVALY